MTGAVERFDPAAPIPAGFADTVRSEVAELDDGVILSEYHDRLAALESYLAHRADDCAVVRRAQRYVEVRIGELLGPATPGQRTDMQPSIAVEGLTKDERHDFRQMAAHPELVEAALADGDVSRRAVLQRIRNSALFSSDTDEWETPQELFDALDAEFGFKVDVCATAENAKTPHFFTRADDGLNQDWVAAGVCWMNPPYGKNIGRWVEKARMSAESGATVVCLLPARTDTAWWWDHCLAGEIRFLRGRLRFSGSDAGAPFPSAVVVFGPDVKPASVWSPALEDMRAHRGELSRGVCPADEKDAINVWVGVLDDIADQIGECELSINATRALRRALTKLDEALRRQEQRLGLPVGGKRHFGRGGPS
jgi:phage N-6-adenine-methyltransferase